MNIHKQYVQNYDDKPKERNAFFITVSFHSVIDAFKAQAKAWLDAYGNVLRTLGERELTAIKEEIDAFYVQIKSEQPTKIEDLKSLLNTVTEIKNTTMIMEFRITEVVERFRTLKMY